MNRRHTLIKYSRKPHHQLPSNSVKSCLSMREMFELVQRCLKQLADVGITFTSAQIYTLQDLAYHTLQPDIVNDLCEQYIEKNFRARNR